MTNFVGIVAKHPDNQSLPAAILQQMHTESLECPVAVRSSHEWLVWAEYQIKQEKYQDVINNHKFVNDLRCQDAVFRSRWYLRNGLPEVEKIGYELAGFHCSIPFYKLDILPGGNSSLCCSAWLRTSSGNLFRGEDVWNSPNSQSVRSGILDGTYKHCGKEACYCIRSIHDPKVHVLQLEDKSLRRDPVVPDSPRVVNLSYDFTCNLSCPSCRKNKIVAGDAEQKMLHEHTENYVIPHLRGAEHVEITGSGDPFASRTYYRLLQRLNPEEFPRLKITLMTNGVLLDEKVWERIAHIAPMIERINVSVDAAEKATYAAVRRLGDWDRLMKNLAMVGELRKQSAIRKFRLCFVAQRRNYREMTQFVSLAESVSADEVHFQQLGDWGVLGDYRKEAVHLPSHPEHDQFLKCVGELPANHQIEILHEFE